MTIEDHKSFIDLKPETCFKREEEETSSIYIKVRTTLYSIAINLKNGDIVELSPKCKVIPFYEAKLVIE